MRADTGAARAQIVVDVWMLENFNWSQNDEDIRAQCP
jgi:hypothetical protein